MLDYMSSQGISPVSINWSQTDQMCLGLKTDASDTAYNKCSYEKARDLTLFNNDKGQCDIQAKGAYPDSFLRGRTDTLTETDKGGAVHTFQRTSTSLSTHDLDQGRAAALVDCMQKLGWVNANDWHLGKRSSYCQ